MGPRAQPYRDISTLHPHVSPLTARLVCPLQVLLEMLMDNYSFLPIIHYSFLTPSPECQRLNSGLHPAVLMIRWRHQAARETVVGPVCLFNHVP